MSMPPPQRRAMGVSAELHEKFSLLRCCQLRNTNTVRWSEEDPIISPYRREAQSSCFHRVTWAMYGNLQKDNDLPALKLVVHGTTTLGVSG